MTTTTTTLAAWLLDRIAADEAAARAAFCDCPRLVGHDRNGMPMWEVEPDDGRWSVTQHAGYDLDDQREVQGIGLLIYDEGGHTRGQAAHIARHDPARVLREVEAHRAIVRLHSVADPCDFHDAEFKTIPCPTLRALASVYADHEGYRSEWA